MDYRSLLDLSQAAALIKDVVAGLKTGKVSEQHGDQQLTVEAPEAINVSVRARQTWRTEGLTSRVR